MSSLTSRQDGSTDRLLHDFPNPNPSPPPTPSSGLFLTLMSYVDYFSPALAANMAAVHTESPSPPSKASDPEQIELGKPRFHIIPSRLYTSILVDSLVIGPSILYKLVLRTYAAGWRVSRKAQGPISVCLGLVLGLALLVFAWPREGPLGLALGGMASILLEEGLQGSSVGCKFVARLWR